MVYSVILASNPVSAGGEGEKETGLPFKSVSGKGGKKGKKKRKGVFTVGSPLKGGRRREERAELFTNF